MPAYHESPLPHQDQSTEAAGDHPAAGCASRRSRRRQQRVLISLGTPLLPTIDRAEWRALPRAERRQRLRAAMRPTESEVEMVVRAGLAALGERLALDWVRTEMESDADELCGAPKGRHCKQRKAWRHGYEEGSVAYEGRRLVLLRPRVRSLDGQRELIPRAYEEAQDESLLSERMMREVMAGVALRRYESTVPSEPEGTPPPGSVSRSTVSRRCKEQMRALLQQQCERRLDGERYLALFTDGIDLGGHRIIVSLGVTEAGDKQVLGLWAGDTESEVVCRAALEDLVQRGLDASGGLLAVLDGGKGLHAAARAVWGERVLIQRCTVHKLRNIKEHLPAERAARVAARVQRAWGQADPKRAERLLERVAEDLEREGYGEAAGSVREGLEETLTCMRLGLPPELRRVLETTNAIESSFSRNEDVTHRVKRWRDGDQALRWLATSLALAEQSFGSLPGAEHLPTLRAGLQRHVATLAPLAVGA